jgi:hypothetical protein
MAFSRFVEVTVGEKNGAGFKIDGLKIAFKIEKTDSPDPNTATIKIYNLSQDASSKVCVAGNHITLRAGYRDETVSGIFFGDALKGERYRDGNDYITELQAQDGRGAVTACQVSVSYAKGVSASTVARDFLSAIGLVFKGEDKIPGGEKYPFGFSYMGMATDGLL